MTLEDFGLSPGACLTALMRVAARCDDDRTWIPSSYWNWRTWLGEVDYRVYSDGVSFGVQIVDDELFIVKNTEARRGYRRVSTDQQQRLSSFGGPDAMLATICRVFEKFLRSIPEYEPEPPKDILSVSMLRYIYWMEKSGKRALRVHDYWVIDRQEGVPITTHPLDDDAVRVNLGLPMGPDLHALLRNIFSTTTQEK